MTLAAPRPALLLSQHKPTHVIHLAAMVGGLFKNMKYKVEMMTENLLINQNVLQCAHECGVKRCAGPSHTQMNRTHALPFARARAHTHTHMHR